jgi:hypothetical protein
MLRQTVASRRVSSDTSRHTVHLWYRPVERIFEVPDKVIAVRERTMLGKNVVDEELKRGLGLSIKEIEPFLRAGGDAAEMKFMECCRYLWQANGVELIEPFIEAVFNKLPEKSRCVLFQRMLTIVYLAQDGERLPTPPLPAAPARPR